MPKTDAQEAQERKFEEKLYNEVAQELHQGKRHDATWAKALAQSKGDNGLAQGLYIEYRVQSMKDDVIIQQENQKIEAQREKEEAQREKEEAQREINRKKKSLQLLQQYRDEQEMKKFKSKALKVFLFVMAVTILIVISKMLNI